MEIQQTEGVKEEVDSCCLLAHTTIYRIVRLILKLTPSERFRKKKALMCLFFPESLACTCTMDSEQPGKGEMEKCEWLQAQRNKML